MIVDGINIFMKKLFLKCEKAFDSCTYGYLIEDNICVCLKQISLQIVPVPVRIAPVYQLPVYFWFCATSHAVPFCLAPSRIPGLIPQAIILYLFC